MKYFQLEGIINEELLTKFMDFCNNYLHEDCTVVINSSGGKNNLATVILDIINSNTSKFTLVSAGCYSAAFYIFYSAKCKRKIIKGSIGMYHKSFAKDINVDSDSKPVYYEDKCLIDNFKDIDNSFILNLLTPKEKKLFQKNDDVYFTFKRMTEIFPDVEVVK